MGKLASVHISRAGIHILEGNLNAGTLKVFKLYSIEDVSGFFNEDKLINLTELVYTVINTMRSNKSTIHDLSIVYDLGAEVDFYLDEKPIISSSRGGSLKSLFKKSDDDENEATKKVSNTITGIIKARKSWGRYMTETEQGNMYTTVSIERDLVENLIYEFGEFGYNVKSIETPETAILYLRKYIPYTYDHLNKVVIYADNRDNGTLYGFTKDAPSLNKSINFYAADQFEESVELTLNDEVSKNRLKNPQVFLVGSAFDDVNDYAKVCNHLVSNGYCVIDFLGLLTNDFAKADEVKVISEVPISGKYGICMACAMRGLDSKPENFKALARVPLINRRNKKLLSAISIGIGIVTAACCLSITLLSSYECLADQAELSRASGISESALLSVESKRNIVKEKLSVIDSIDERYNQIFKFVSMQSNENINIASVDTIDMIPTAKVTTSRASSSKDDKEEEVPVLPVKKVMVLRGYAKSPDGPAELYRALRKSGLGESKLTGVQQVVLPSEETIFVFEMTINVV